MPRTGKSDAKDTAPRDLGRYRLHGEIASGGMATVYFGRLVGTSGFAKTVAIKCLHPQFAKVPEFVTMFLAEARLASRIRHPNVAQTLDVLETEDEIFLVLEYIDGESLSRLIRATRARKERVPLEVAVTIMCGVLHGLHAAHEAKNDKGEPLGIVHRDVSPQNVLVGIDGVPRVIDFGIAKAADSVQITREGELKGKLSYMAPEQLEGGKITRRVDVYAASVMLWELLTGQRLFDADYQSAILKNILHRPIDPPSEIARDVPSHMDAIVMKGLSRDAEGRFATAREMALALEAQVVLANPSHVGAWVENVAAESLERRAARIAQIEGVPSAPLPERTPAPLPDMSEEVVSDMFVTDSRERAEEASARHWKQRASEPPGPTIDVVETPSIVERPTSAVARPLPTQRSVASDDRPPVSRQPPSRPSAPPRSASGGVGSIGPLLPPPTITVPETTVVAPAWPVPGIPAAPPGTETLPEAKKRSQGGGTLMLLFVVALAIAGFYFVLPELMKRGYVASAAREGLALSIDQVEVSLQAVHLRGVTMSAVEVPGVTVRARLVDITLRKLDPIQMSIHDGVLSADGSYAQVHDAVASWTTAHATRDDAHGTLERIVLESGKVIWNRPFGEATRLDAENVAGSIERDLPHLLGEDLELTAPLVSVTTTSAGKIGPWSLRWRKQPSVSQVTLVLDPVSGAQATALVSESRVTSLEVAVPHVAAAQLGLSPTAFGRRAEDPLTIDATLKCAVPQPTRLAADLHLALSGARFAGAASVMDVTLDGKIDGDPAQPLDVRDGVLALGSIRGRLAGSVTAMPAFVKGDLTWKPGVRCPGSSDQTVSATVRFDSRAVDEPAVTVQPSGRCGLKILPP